MFDTRVSRLGVDAVEPERLAQRLGRNPRLEAELFTEAERAYCRRQAKPIEHLAVRFCAKEAVVKALTIDGFEPLEIEVAEPCPAPIVLLSGDVAARARELRVRVQVSLTHIESVAIAVAIAEPYRFEMRAAAAALRTTSRTVLRRPERAQRAADR